MADTSVAPPKSGARFTVQTACPLDCPDACSLSVTVDRGRITKIDGNHVAPSTEGYICGKVRRFDRRVYHDARVPYPQVRKGAKGRGDFRRATWDEALDLIAEKMIAARDRDGAESVLPFYYGGSNGLLTNDTPFQIHDFDGSMLVGDANRPAAGHNPHEVLMKNLEAPLVRKIDREWLERSLLSRLSDLFCRHGRIMGQSLSKVQP